MPQTEIAGCRMTLPGEIPAKGRRFPDLELIAASGRQIRLSDYRGRSNLVLVFAGNQGATEALLSEMGRSYDRFRNEEADIIAVAQCPRDECERIEQPRVPFAVFPDEDGRIHREVGASDQQGRPAAAVYVTDRYGEVFAAYPTHNGQALPGTADILSWLQFINIQCPECEPPEWPP